MKTSSLLAPGGSSLCPSPGGDNTLTTKGDLLTFDGTSKVRLPIGTTNGYALVVDSAQSSGMRWAHIDPGLAGLGLNNALAIWNGTDTLKHNDELLTSGSSLIWASDGGGSIGAAGANRPANVYALTTVTSAGTLVSGTTTTVGTNLLWASDGSGSIGAAAATRPDYVYIKTGLNIANGGFTASSTAVLGASGTAITIGDKNLMWSSDGGGDIGAAAATRPNNLYVKLAGAFGSTVTVGTNLLWASDGSGDIGAVAATRPNNLYVKLAGVVGSTFTVGTNLLWASDGSGDVGAAAATRPANIYGSTSLNLGNGANVATTTALTISSAMAVAETLVESKGLVLRNTTAAIEGGLQQYAPAIYLGGQSTDSTAHTSIDVTFRISSKTYQYGGGGATLYIDASTNGAAYTPCMYLDSHGATGSTGIYGSAYYYGLLAFSPDNTYSIGATSSTYRPSYIYVGTGSNIGNGANVATTTALTISSAMALGTTPDATKSIYLDNTTAAANGAQQISPAIYQGGRGWETTGGSSDVVLHSRYVLPVQGTNVAGSLVEAMSLNGGAPTTLSTLSSAGCLALPVASSYASAGASGSEIFLASTAVTDTGVSIYQGNTAHVLQLRSVRADGSGNISLRLLADVNAAAITADHKVLSVGWVNNADAITELWHFRGDGEIRSASTSTATITGAEADGATAIGLKVNTAAAYSNAAAKLLSVQNNGTEKVYVRYDGLVRSAIAFRAAGDDAAGEASTVTYTGTTAAKDSTAATLGETPTGIAAENAAWIKVRVGTTIGYIPYWTA